MLIISLLVFILLVLPAPLGALGDGHNIDISVKLSHWVSMVRTHFPFGRVGCVMAELVLKNQNDY